ncbi:hypothetical protein ASF43_01185 [Pseudorhodoferax sp. Leaf267]|nr:hypothetical protein ASF43_01185 [Pseudorhodoferax sp. Leaf267]
MATGAALAGAAVVVTDRTGTSACTASPVLADPAGAYRCTLVPSAAAPLLLVATDPAGLVEPMVSLTTAVPAAGQVGTANVSPLTTAIVAQLAPNRDAFALARDPALVAALDPASVNAVKANVVRQLAAVISSVQLDPATFDFVSTPFVGGSNTGADSLLDQVRVTFENGVPVVANVLTPGAAPVALADATTTSAPAVGATTVTGFSITELDVFKTAFEACFAVPSATRPDSAACDGLFVDDAPSASTGGATYRNSGYDTEGSFGALVASADMDGAKFNRPELLRYTVMNDGRDQAVINLRFADKNGVGDNRILTVKKFPGTQSATRTSAWWLYGNQRTVNAYVRAAIRKQEQLLPEAFHAQYDVAPSRYQTGLEIFIARPGRGPNSEGLRYARVKGPGLPDAGLVYADANGLPHNWMTIFNTTGVIPATQQFANGAQNIFYLQRTLGIVGSDAFNLRTNPYQASPTPQFLFWAHPTMYGEAPSASWRFDLSKVPSWSRYAFELFYAAPDGSTEPTPRVTFSSSIVTPVVPAAYAATQQWHEIPAATRALASDGAPAASTVTLDWVINPYAQRVDSVNVYSYSDATGTVNSPSITVGKSASSQAATASGGGQFPALTTSFYTSRTLQWRYKILDGSYKDQTVQFN